MQSHEIKKALSGRHTKDFFGTEVKTGASEIGCLRFDAYAIKKSWTNLKYTGYEVKISRSDFLQDDKWRGYLNFCNEFYWVCPKDLIKKEEISDEAGLIYCYPDTHVLRVVKKAKFRSIDAPVSVLLYLIMWQITDSRYPFFNHKKDFFEEWLKNKKECRELGYNVSKRFKEETRSFEEIERKNQKLESDLSEYEELKSVLRKNGFNICHSFGYARELEERLKLTVPKNVLSDLEEIHCRAEKLLQKFKSKGEPHETDI